MRRLVRLSKMGSILFERRGWCFTLVHSLHPVCRHGWDGQLSVRGRILGALANIYPLGRRAELRSHAARGKHVKIQPLICYQVLRGNKKGSRGYCIICVVLLFLQGKTKAECAQV